MIVKMKFLSITGPRADIDRMTNRYLSKYEMQLENALTELKTVDNLMPFLEMNPYRDPLAKVTQFLGYMKDMPAEPSFDQSEDEILEMIRSINHDYMDLQQQKEELKKKRENIQARMKVLEPFTSLDFDLHEIMSLAPPGQSLAFSLGDEKGFEWIGAYDITADELLAGTDTAKTESKTAQAQMLILELLADGKRMPSAELEKAVNERGISSRTMRTAKSRIGDRLVTEKDGTAWVCYLRD